jgi:2-dehydropantoate 2-reductase
MNSDIFIIGSGAIGKALAVFLKRAQRNVTIIRGSVSDGSRKTELLRVETADGIMHQASVDIVALNTLNVLDGIIVLANKSYGNQQLASTLTGKTGKSPIVLLQNGLGIEQPFIDQGFPEIYRCVLLVTSQSVDNVSVRFKPVGICPVGIEKGNQAGLYHIVDQLHTPHFGFQSEMNIQQMIWKKAIVNSVFNSVCPLLEVDNGIFHRNEIAMQLARRVISECTMVARSKGILIQADQVEDSLLQISKFSDGQLISTLQDIRNKRKTELNTLNSEIVRIAENLGMAETVRETKLLGQLAQIKADINFEGIC